MAIDIKYTLQNKGERWERERMRERMREREIRNVWYVVDQCIAALHDRLLCEIKSTKYFLEILQH